ncbi:hypothetical protein STEG23_024717, partial [Scotinomys teguina]
WCLFSASWLLTLPLQLDVKDIAFNDTLPNDYLSFSSSFSLAVIKPCAQQMPPSNTFRNVDIKQKKKKEEEEEREEKRRRDWREKQEQLDSRRES